MASLRKQVSVTDGHCDGQHIKWDVDEFIHKSLRI